MNVLNAISIMALTTGLFAGCISAPSPGHDSKNQAPISDPVLYVHLLAPGIPGQTPARRIVSARVYLSQEIFVSIGATEDPFKTGWDAAFTTAMFDTNGVAQPRPLGAVWNSGDAVLAGRIVKRDGKFLVHLQGRNQTTLNYFQGEVELEKPVYEHGGSYRNDGIWGVWFALSEDPNCHDFLKSLDDGTLRYPLVGADSAAAKDWTEKQVQPQKLPAQ